MKRKLKDQIREALMQHPDGLTRRELAEMLNRPTDNIRVCLAGMWGVYIAAWAPAAVRGPQAAVFKTVTVPPDAPRPKPAPKTLEQIAAEREKKRAYAREYQRTRYLPKPRPMKEAPGPNLTFWQPVKPWPNGVAPQ